jgi:MFS family permease
MNKKEKLWTPSFLVLWQSQLVSTIGDAVYSIALGFWVLQVTGSTALMGALMAASTLPGILVAPFAGVWIDRTDKKRLLILTDLVRGACVVLLAAAAYAGQLEIWMVFAAGILLSAGGAVFSPGVSSSIPELVPPSKISNANSVFSVVSTGSGLIGNVAGGFLYQALGAPLLFLINGLSFLFSCASLPFVKIQSVRRVEKTHFFTDMSDGFKYMWQQRGLRLILIIAAFINFFFNIAVVLFLPLFEFDPALGSARYGVAMACYLGGMAFGFLVMSIISVKSKDKLWLMIAANITSNLLLILVFNQPYFALTVVMLALAGLTNAVVNVLLISAVQLSTPAEMRGKVMSFMNAICGGLTPIAMALGGVLGSFLPLRLVITSAFIVGSLTIVPIYFSKSFKSFLVKDYVAEEIAAPSENIQEA